MTSVWYFVTLGTSLIMTQSSKIKNKKASAVFSLSFALQMFVLASSLSSFYWHNWYLTSVTVRRLYTSYGRYLRLP